MVWHPVSHTHTQNEVNPGKRFLGKEEERKKERKKQGRREKERELKADFKKKMSDWEKDRKFNSLPYLGSCR